MAPVSDVDFSTVDLYALLAIPPTSSESEIRRAYRKTSRLYHPDKVTPTPETLEKFQLLQHAIEVLTDVTERAKYDSGREAKLRRAAEHAALDERRRKMKEDLERRETAGTPVTGVNGVKRTWTDRELEMKRIQEENRRRREALMTQRMEEFKKAEEVVAEPADDEVSRSVKVRWVREGVGLEIDDQALTQMFPSGEVENVVVLKDKKRKLDGKNKKVAMGTAVLVFKSLAVARRVVSNGKFDELESVEWMVKGEDKTEKT